MNTLPGAQLFSDSGWQARPAGPSATGVKNAKAFANLVDAHPTHYAAAKTSPATTTALPDEKRKAADDQPGAETTSLGLTAHHGEPVRDDTADVRAKQRDTTLKDDETADCGVQGGVLVVIQAIPAPIDDKPANDGQNPGPSPDAESVDDKASAGLFQAAEPARSVRPDPKSPGNDKLSASIVELESARAPLENGNSRSGAKNEQTSSAPATPTSTDTRAVATKLVVETERHALVPGGRPADPKTPATKPADGVAVEAAVRTTAPVASVVQTTSSPQAVMLDAATVEASRSVAATTEAAPTTSSSAPIVANAPTFATEITIAAARYSLPKARANDAPQTVSSAATEVTGMPTSDMHRDHGARLKPVSVLSPAVDASAGAPDRVDENATEGAEAEDLSTQPGRIKTDKDQGIEPRKPPRFDAQSVSVASQAPVVIESGPQSTRSPANSVALAIVAEPTWRPSSVAIATQSSPDRIPETPKTLSVQLNPGNLGVVTANLSMSGSTLKVHLAAESLEAHDRLKAETHTIEKAMHSLGYEVSEITITQSAVASTSLTKPEQAPQNGSSSERNPQSSSNNSTGGDRPARQTGDRNGHESPSLKGVHATRATDASGSGVYI